jgi:hypothetical protein
MGLTGLGISFLIGYVLYFIQVFIISNINYDFSFDAAFIRVFATQVVLAVSCFFVVKLLSFYLAYGIGSLLILISVWYSLRELDKRIDMRNLFMNIKNKK